MDYLEHDLTRILLTGASGYLGGKVLARFRDAGMPCIAASFSGRVGEQCDLTDFEAVSELVSRVGPTAIVHCAAHVPRAGSDYENESAAKQSTIMVKRLSDAASCRIVFISSMTVYETTSIVPVDEYDARTPKTSYAAGKWESEQLILSRDKAHGNVALRLPGLFGLPRRSGVLYNAASSFLTNRRLELSGAPVMWAAMHVDDAADYVFRATVSSSKVNEPLNVGYPGAFNVVDAVSQIAKLCEVSWTPPPIQAPSFAMHLYRLEERYGLIATGFSERLKELVDLVRNELNFSTGESIAGRAL